MTSEPIAAPQAPPTHLRYQLVMFSLTRTVMNTGYRMIYPFLPAIARGLNVSVEAVTLTITLRATLGFFGAAFGLLADSRGRKTAMLVGLGVFISGMILVTAFPTYPALLIGMLCVGAAKLLFDPSMQAYLGDRTAYNQRGRAIAITEFGWAGAALLGIPVVGWLIARGGWNLPFPFLVFLGLVVAAALWRMLPQDQPHATYRPSFRAMMGTVLSHRPALVGIAIGLLLSASNEIISVNYGSWMENSFNLQVATVGIAFTVIGLAELSGEGLVAAIADRLGKRRAVILGFLAYTGASLLLPILATNLTGALIGLFLFYLGFEYTLVCLIPLMTELVPTARATMMSGAVTAFSLGRALGSLVGPGLFALGGIPLTGAVGALVNLICVSLLVVFIKEHTHNGRNS